MKRLVLVALILAAGLAASAAAEEGGSGGAQKSLQGDKNGDGVISRDEWTGRADVFDRIDSNGDGKLDAVEIAAAKGEARQRIEERVEGRMEEGRGPRTPEGGRSASEKEKMRQRAYGAALFAVELFRSIDANNDGNLSMDEVDKFAAKIKEADADKDGFISKDEVREYFHRQIARRIGGKFIQKFDADKDGKVTPEEFGAGDEKFKRLDTNGDGAITIEDFLARKPGPGREEGEGPGNGRHRGRPGGPARGEMGPGGVDKGWTGENAPETKSEPKPADKGAGKAE
jgi:Ca2+-binding EF-hand superfamily protein